MLTSKRTVILGLAVAVLAYVFDQYSKTWLINLLAARPPIRLAPFFDLVMVWNHGISFGMFAGHRQPWPLITLSLTIMAILLIWLYKNTSPLVACALGLVLGGAAGNVADRLRFGAVADFFDAHLGPYHWPAFNIADSEIFIGVVLLFASSMLKQHR